MDIAFGSLLRRAREAASLSQEELAHRSGLTVNGISQLERGVRTRPYPHTVRALADALGLGEQERDRLVAAVPPRRRPGATRPARRPADVPSPVIDLIGRDTDLADVLAAIERHRLVTLTGPGGVGKTSLAIAAARAAADRFTDGVTFVGLAAVEDVEVALLSIARSVGLVDSGAAEVREQLRTAFHLGTRLLVLDNLEQLPGLTAEVADLLSVTPPLTVLATSRAPLHLRVEHELPVRPLPLPTVLPTDGTSAAAGTGTVLDNDAVRLLLARAQQSAPPAVTDDPAALARICHRVDGLPLALELAAAWLRVLSPSELADRLTDALPLLVDGPRDLPERHRTMRDAIAWSEALLEPDNRHLLRRLGVLPGSWDLETAAAVVDRPEPDILRGVALLVERNLVMRDEPDLEGHARFRLLETVRAYAREQLERHDDPAAARARLADAVLDLAEQASDGLDGADQGIWLDRVEDRLPDVRAALRSALEVGDADLAARCYGGLFWLWFLRHATEGAGWGRQILANDRVRDPSAKARAEAALAVTALACGDLAPASRHASSAADHATVAGDGMGVLRALAVYANVAAASGDISATHRAAERLAEVGGGDRPGFPAAARALATLARARVSLASGDHGSADALLEAADRDVDRAAAPWPRVLWLNIAVAADQVRGRHDRTLPRLRRSIAMSGELGDAPATLHALAALGVDLALRQRPHDAAVVFGATDALGERTGLRITDPATLELVAGHRSAVVDAIGEDAFERATAEGATLSAEQALERAGTPD